jgi:hypothetical protein
VQEIPTRAKAEGDIEDLETVLLGPHGDELDGLPRDNPFR